MPSRLGRVLAAAGSFLLLALLLISQLPAWAVSPQVRSSPHAVLAEQSTPLETPPVITDTWKYLPFIVMAPTPVPPTIVVTELGSLGGDYSVAHDVNNPGWVVGTSYTGKDLASAPYHAFLWRDGKMRDLRVPGGEKSIALRVNDRGQVAGNSERTATGRVRGFFWENNASAEIGTFGANWSLVVDMNDVEQVIGYSGTAEGRNHCFLWAAHVMTDLGTLGGDECYPADINNGGQIVGTVTLPDGDVRAFVWENGMMTSLAPNRSSKAVAINEFGDIIGFEKDPDRSCGDTFCATLWTHGHRIDLRRGGVGFADGMLQAINNEGQIVGYGGPPASPNQFEGRKPLLWVDGVLTELGTAQGTVPNYATLLNNRGLIIVDQDDRPTLWWDGMLYPLPIPDVSEARQLWGTAAMGISDSGYVAGATLSGRAFRWKVELPE